MDFKQLEAFTSVVSLGSFSRAAEKLYLTQPTISAHIGSLEFELNTQLIVRTPKEAYPSETGKILYEYALDMLALREQAVSACLSATADMSGSISIAASSIPYQYLLPGMISEFREQYPDISFELISSDSAGVISAILSGKAEMGLTGSMMESSKCVYQEIADDNLVVITPNLKPYSDLEENGFTLNHLKQFPFIIREPGSGTRRETESYLQKKGLKLESLRIAAQMDDPDAIKKSVGRGMGISIMSQLAASDYEEFGLIRVFHPEKEPIKRKLYLVRHKSRPVFPIAQAFLEFAITSK